MYMFNYICIERVTERMINGAKYKQLFLEFLSLFLQIFFNFKIILKQKVFFKSLLHFNFKFC